jgi:hypothetical protein
VVWAVGDHSPYYALEDRDPGPSLLGYPLGLMIVRETTFPLPEPPVDVRTTDWYPRLRHLRAYEMWGQPRPLEPDSVRRYGRIGRVPIYRNHDDRRDPPGVLYVLTGPERTDQPFGDWSAFEPCQ